jgi:hypothetical protein
MIYYNKSKKIWSNHTLIINKISITVSIDTIDTQKLLSLKK